ncbi:MAG TPA: hypothetical protein V6D20_15205 [Candidatus Obscuribacterales bacterium]
MAIAADSSIPRCSPEEWADFLHLVRHGMLFEVIKWIDSGKPTLRPENKHVSPLEEAVAAPNLSLTQVLWERAWQDEAEADRAMHALTWRKGSTVILRYLLENGCPTGWLSGYDLCLTHDLDLVRLGMKRGVNILEPDGWASAFRQVGSRPLIRFYLEEKDRIPGLKKDAVVAMCRCIAESRLRALSLLKWAGVDPLGRGPSYFWNEDEVENEENWDGFPALHICLAEQAEEILKFLKLKPSIPQWLEMLDHCCSSLESTFNAVLDLMPDHEAAFEKCPEQAGQLLVRFMRSVTWARSSWSRPRDKILNFCMKMAEAGVQAVWRNESEINRFRRDFYKAQHQEEILRVIAKLEELATEKSKAELKLLIDKPKMRVLTRQMQPSLMDKLGLIQQKKKQPRKKANTGQSPSTPAARAIPQPRPYPKHLHSGAVVVKRKEIHEKIWNQPASSLAKEFGVSGSMLARICTLLNIPRPPRGYWAKRQAGYKVAKQRLPKLREGQRDSWAFYSIKTGIPD